MKPYQQNTNCSSRVKILEGLEDFSLNYSLYSWKTKEGLYNTLKKKKLKSKKNTVKEWEIPKDDMSTDKIESENVKQIYCQNIS